MTSQLILSRREGRALRCWARGGGIPGHAGGQGFEPPFPPASESHCSNVQTLCTVVEHPTPPLALKIQGVCAQLWEEEEEALSRIREEGGGEGLKNTLRCGGGNGGGGRGGREWATLFLEYPTPNTSKRALRYEDNPIML